jgi:replication factor A2
MYVRVFGIFKIFGTKKSLNLLKIVPVQSVDEITYHLLSVVSAHLLLTKPKKPSKLGMGLDGANLDSFNKSAYAQPQMQSFSTGGGFTGLQGQIMGFFQQTIDTTTGGSIQDLVHRLRGVADEGMIRYFF